MSPARRGRPSGKGGGRKGSSTGRSTRSAGGSPAAKGSSRTSSGSQRGGGRGGRGKAPGRSTPAKGLGGKQVEGRQAVRELLLAGTRKAHEIWLATDLDPAPVLTDIVELAREARVVVKEVSRSKLEAAARTDAPQGVLARAATLPEADLDDLGRRGRPGAAPFLLALDGVTDPGNLGALLRTAEAAGVSGVLLPRHRAVHITPTVAKAAAGAVEHLPMALVPGLPSALARLRELGVWSVGLDAAGDRPLWDLDLADEPVVLVLGAEGAGLSRLTRQRCDQVAAIPLLGRLDSLNVAAAGALACFEVTRRRARR